MLYKTTFDEFCKKLTTMKVGQSFDFAANADEDDKGKPIPDSESEWYGVTRLHLFDCDRFIIASYGGNPEFIITVNGCPSEPYEYVWDDTQSVFKELFGLKEFREDGLAVYIEEKNDAELVTEILRKYGWRVENAIEGLEISDGTYTIGALLKPSPDAPEGEEHTDFYAFSGDERTDGHLCVFTEGYPDDYEIRTTVQAAFDDERKYQQ